MRVAIMQPYFFPYAGYFRLIAAADRFVIYDDVQFPRRGWVHRNRLPGDDGELRWLTLPLIKAPFDATIASLRAPPDAAVRLTAERQRFPALRDADPAHPLVAAMLDPRGTVVDHLERTLSATCDALSLRFQPVRSSTLGIDPALRAQDRILAIAEALGAIAYVNAPGGASLYDPHDFAARGMELRVLKPWEGPLDSILQRLLTEDAGAVAAQIRGQLSWASAVPQGAGQPADLADLAGAA